MSKLANNACLWRKKLNFHFFISLFSGVAHGLVSWPESRRKPQHRWTFDPVFHCNHFILSFFISHERRNIPWGMNLLSIPIVLSFSFNFSLSIFFSWFSQWMNFVHFQWSEMSFLAKTKPAWFYFLQISVQCLVYRPSFFHHKNTVEQNFHRLFPPLEVSSSQKHTIGTFWNFCFEAKMSNLRWPDVWSWANLVDFIVSFFFFGCCLKIRVETGFCVFRSAGNLPFASP